MIKHCLRQLTIAAALTAALANSPVRAEDKAGAGSSFVERFQTLDPKRWFVSDGWTNGEHQGCTWSAANLRLANGGLELILKDVPQAAGAAKLPFTCAEIQTNAVFGYGTYEVRMRAAAGPGLVSAFFTYIGPQPDAPAPHDEIDFEFLGKDRHAVQLNYYANEVGGHEKIAALGFDGSQQMADYAFEWRPDSIRWLINGKLVHELKPEAGKPFPATPGKIMLSLWSGHDLTDWLGNFIYPGEPLVARYELVAFTRAGDPCQFPGSVVCKQRGQASLDPTAQAQR